LAIFKVFNKCIVVDASSDSFHYYTNFEHSTFVCTVSARSELQFLLTTTPVFAIAAHTQEHSSKAAFQKEGAIRRLNTCVIGNATTDLTALQDDD